ncbi:MAG: c-type cytochrome [bacterium]|nr:c-type cytochrome [bacterium]
MDSARLRHLKIILLVSSVVTLVLLLLSAYQEHFAGTWRGHQTAYRAQAVAHASTDATRAAAQAMGIGLRQVFLPALDRVDRCTTCHVGIDDPGMADADLPLRVHSGDVFKHHPVDKFGCTICHDGQGRAVELEAAHGDVAHWDKPLLRGTRVYTNCSRCHYEADPFGAEQDLHAASGEPKPLVAAELNASLPGEDRPNATALARGKRLLLSSGCLGCHQYRGRGGTLGPDITYVGDQTVHDFDFQHVHGERTVEQWLIEHFKHPAEVSPGSLMPEMDLTDQQTLDLTLYLLGLHRKSMPAEYTPVPPRLESAPASGKQLYAIFCSGCHGGNGHGSTVREAGEIRAIDAPPELMVPSLNHADTLAVASDDYLRSIITGGRHGTTMIAWGLQGDGGLRGDEITALVEHIRSWAPPPPDRLAISHKRGDRRAGEAIYTRNCSACHGRRGEGGIGVSLNSPSFLAIASDDFLAATIIDGRPNTAMPGWHELDSQQISDVIAYMRGWQASRHDRETVLRLAAVRAGDPAPGVSARVGQTLYQANCVTCHGANGEGDLGPSLATQEFLTVVGNDYLCDTIARGRSGTGMPSWRHLSSADVASLIVFMRTWQSQDSRTLPSDTIVGDWDTGRFLYQGACAGCHGEDAEGGVGPQLNNPEFLRIATDGMLREWITHGKTATPMRGFLKGGQGMVELRARQIDDLVAYLRSLERRSRVSVAKRPSGRPELGRLWYAVSCAACHGESGEGSSGPALANRGFLRAASDGFLMATLAMGRDGTEMRPVKKGAQSILSLSSDQLNDIVALLRSWEHDPPQEGVTHRYVVPWDLERGRRLYESNCAGCHGINGQAEINDPGRLSAWAPNLNNEGFLAAATDGFLQATIVRGRAGTAMRPFGHGSQGLVDLSSDDIDDLVAYIRRWSTEPGLPMTIPAEIKAAAHLPLAAAAISRPKQGD